MTTSRDKFFYTRTLCSLLKALEGAKTEIELRNESHVKGIVESVSASMSVTMRNCELIVAGRTRKLERFLVQGRKIRMVVIPDDVNMIDAMQAVISMYNNPVQGKNEYKKFGLKGKGRGMSRGRGVGRGRSRNVVGLGRGTVGNARGRGERHTVKSLRGRGNQGSRGRKQSPMTRGGHFQSQTQRNQELESDSDGRPTVRFGGKDSGHVHFFSGKSGTENRMSSQSPGVKSGSLKRFSMLNPEYMQQTSETKAKDSTNIKSKRDHETERKSISSDHVNTAPITADAKCSVYDRTESMDKGTRKSSSKDLRQKLHRHNDLYFSHASKEPQIKHTDKFTGAEEGSSPSDSHDHVQWSVGTSDDHRSEEGVSASADRHSRLYSSDLRCRLSRQRNSSPVSQETGEKHRTKTSRTVSGSGHFPVGSSRKEPHRHKSDSRDRKKDHHVIHSSSKSGRVRSRDMEKDHSRSSHRSEKHHGASSSTSTHYSHTRNIGRSSASPLTAGYQHEHSDSDSHASSKTLDSKGGPTGHSDIHKQCRKSSSRRSSESETEREYRSSERDHSAKSHHLRDKFR